VNLARAENGVVAAVEAALLDHKVLFFRSQDISQDDQVAFAQRLGELTGGHPTLPSPEGQQFILGLDS
jgi:alpha-ketoglutarate-dependent sulfate ester dioxygenase